MRLEDAISNVLFSTSPSAYGNNVSVNNVIICKAQRGKPIPLCISSSLIERVALVYKRLYYTPNRRVHERSSPRAMYNSILSGYYAANSPLVKLKLKDKFYYSATGTLFTENNELLFYFAKEINENSIIPRLYITPRLLANAALPGKPMEKFFVSTIIPYLINNDVNTYPGCSRTIIEIDNCSDNVFFIPQNTMVSRIPVDQMNSRLNDILSNNEDVLSSFIDNYQ